MIFMAMKSYIFKIYGRVQGVGFRYFTLQKANLLDIKGFVKNMPDGSVYVLAQGDDEKIEIFKNYLKRGPSFSHVKKIVSEVVDLNSQYKNFNIEV